MDIASFEVSPDKRVTIHLVDMPKFGVRAENTTVYIGASPMGKPDEVSSTRQTIVFSAAQATQSGKISVLVMMEGDQLEATSAEDFVYVPVAPSDHRPAVTSVTPARAKPGSRISLRGRNLGEVRVISLSYMGEQIKSYTSTQVVPAADGLSLTFTLPADISPREYLLGLGLKGGDRQITQRKLTIEA